MQRSLKSALKKNELTVGCWITLAHPAIAEIMAKAGFDWLAVDLEHSVITIREAEELIRVIDLCGVAPLVRLTSNDRNLIKRVMDSGARGIIVPMMNSLAEVNKAVEATYYPLKGQRGVGLARAQGYGPKFKDYIGSYESETVIIAQIEHIEAVNNLEDILGHADIDGYIIGPYDLSASMGIPGQFDNPKLIEAIAKIKKVGLEKNKPGGLHIIEPDVAQLQSRIQEGFKFLAYSLDIRMIDQCCRTALQDIKKAGLA